MGGGWWTRLVVCVLSILWGVWMLVPTFVGESAAEKLRAQAQSANVGDAADDEEEDFTLGDEDDEDEAPSGPWWGIFVPTARINLGLDLQGGVDLTLQVEVDEAVISSVQRDLKNLKEYASEDNLAIGDVRRLPGEPVMLIEEVAGGASMGDVQSFVSRRFQNYEPEGTEELENRTYFAFRVKQDHADYISQRAIEQALETLRSRIDATGVKEPSIVLKGGNRINVQLPGMENMGDAVKAIGTTAVLEFMMVDEEVDRSTVDRALLDAQQAMPKELFDQDTELSDWLVRNGKLPSDTRLMWEYTEKRGEKKRSAFYVVKDDVMLTGDDINDAHVAMNQSTNQPYVAMEFKPQGAKIFSDVTGENVGRYFAIVLDKTVRSAPRIREKIGGGRASIEMGTGDYSQAIKEASVLSLVLRTGALPAPVTIGEVRIVGASLGEDAIEAGLNASLLGAGLVIFFMVLFYGRSGFIANLALGVNVMLVMALLAAAGATLTLPGIAGIALTVGMAVDCNIIIYERIREELRLGKTPRASVEAGFEKALLAVLDANITTFIAGVVLYTYGTGPIKGFAVTLMIGIVTTLYTGVFMSRVMMELFSRKAAARFAI